MFSVLAPVSPPPSKSRSCSGTSIPKTISRTRGGRAQQTRDAHRCVLDDTNCMKGAANQDSIIASALWCESCQGEETSIFVSIFEPYLSPHDSNVPERREPETTTITRPICRTVIRLFIPLPLSLSPSLSLSLALSLSLSLSLSRSLSEGEERERHARQTARRMWGKSSYTLR